MPLTHVAKVGSLAASLARGTQHPYWVVYNNGKYYAVKKPSFAGILAVPVLKVFLAAIGASLDSEYDETGLRRDIP